MKTISIYLTIFLILNCVEISYSQITFQKTFGGTGNDVANAILETNDGGYIIAGETTSFGAGSRDVYLIRLNDSGDVLWAKTYGGTGVDYAITVDITNDNGFIIGAHTDSYGAGAHDVYLIKTDSLGDILWTRTYGGTSPDGAYSIRQTTDGGFIIGAHTSSFGAGAHDFYVLKTDMNGDTVWTKTYGGSNGDYFRSLDLVAGGGFILVGETYSFGAGSADIYTIRINNDGDTLWTRTYGGTANDFGYSVKQTTDGGFIIVGSTGSFGPVGTSMVYLIKINATGDTLWTKSYGGISNNTGKSVVQTIDGGYVIAGWSNWSGSYEDVYLIKTDNNGDTLWTRGYGFGSFDYGYAIQQTTDNGYIIAGNAAADIYVIKTDANGNSGCNEFETNTVVASTSTNVGVSAPIIGAGGISGNTTTMLNTGITETVHCINTAVNEAPDNEIMRIQFYPNPSNKFVIIEYENLKNKKYTLTLYDMIGQLVKEIKNITTEQIRVETENLTSGLYFFQLRTDREVLSTGKLIIE